MALVLRVASRRQRDSTIFLFWAKQNPLRGLWVNRDSCWLLTSGSLVPGNFLLLRVAHAQTVSMYLLERLNLHSRLRFLARTRAGPCLHVWYSLPFHWVVLSTHRNRSGTVLFMVGFIPPAFYPGSFQHPISYRLGRPKLTCFSNSASTKR